MKMLTCGRCGRRVFFENVSCSACGAVLGFIPEELLFGAFEIDADGTWQRLGPPGDARRPCANYAQEQVCNWTVPSASPQALCASCRTTHIIPALSKPENRAYWASLEQAKRRLFYSLLSLGLPIPSKEDDAENGVSFQFLEEFTPKEKVLTGHDEGVITLNIAEADDAHRESMRAHLHEPYRSLLGHFRHEIGHYYWDRLIADTPWIDEYRALFGDEQADYGEALKKHYASPVADWNLQYVSAYASSHPWEDWAESWAHYLHMQDGLETAAAWGLRLDLALPGMDSVVPEPLPLDDAPLQPRLVEQWLPVSQFINAMDRSLGTRDSYPFVLPEPAMAKLEFIHKVIAQAARGQQAAAPVTAEPMAEPAADAAPAVAAPADPPAASVAAAPVAAAPAAPAPAPA